MKRSLIIFLFIVGIAPMSLGQQSAIYSQYLFNGLAINPAYAGHDGMLSTTFLSRFQSIGIKGAPKTQTFSLHSPIINKKIGVGLQVFHETIGVTDQSGIYAAYSYRISNDNLSISFGLQGGVNFYKIEYSSLLISDPDDPQFAEDIQSSTSNFGAGIFINTDLFFVGLSMPQMLNGTFDITAEAISEQPIFLYGGYVFDLNPFVKLKPSSLLKYADGRIVEWNINASFLWNDLLWTGLSYRPNNAIAILLEFQLTEQLNIGYAYDMTINSLSKADSGSHEIMLNYQFKFSQKNVNSPRYF